jgi:hypothetical protein
MRDSPPRRVPGVADRHVGDRATHDRAQPVRADEQVTPLLGAVGGSGNDSAAVLFHGRDLRSEAHLARGGRELGLEIGSVDGDRAFEQVRGDLGQFAAPQVRMALCFAGAP